MQASAYDMEMGIVQARNYPALIQVDNLRGIARKLHDFIVIT
jgi:hypothetical protein